MSKALATSSGFVSGSASGSFGAFPSSNSILAASSSMTVVNSAASTIGPISEVNGSGIPLNIDPNPEVIVKKPTEPVHYRQQVSLRFFKPPAPQQPGDIVIRQAPHVQAPPASPLLIRQYPQKPVKPAPVVVREQPPAPPAPIPAKIIVVPGKLIPPPPRKIIVERLPQMPPLPQDIHVERWLGYNDRIRRVRFEPAPTLVPLPAPKNTIIQWSSPDVKLQREFRFLGVVPASPAHYAARFGNSLTPASNIPHLAVSNFKPPTGEVLGIHYRPDVPKLVGGNL